MRNDIASARAASNPTPQIPGQLDALMPAMRNAKEWRTFRTPHGNTGARSPRRTPTLQAAIRAAQTLLPRAF